tara:strand:- start:303 stop:521 length:219 start_codon:yes stop_codon:yes gene_type:complete
MNLAAMYKDWIAELKGTQPTKKYSMQPYTVYTLDDIDNFIKDIKGGKAKAKAGRDNNIPSGSVYHLSKVAGV